MTAASLRNRAPLLSAALFAAAGALCWLVLAPHIAALTPAAGYDIGRMITLYSTLPRMATALLCGAALALSGVIFQIALRNNLASPTTLGVSAGAHLALVLASLFAPSVLLLGRDIVAALGSGIAASLVFALVARRDFSPIALVLSGLVVSLYCGAAATLLVLLNDRYLVSLFIWGAGSLSQQDWSVATSLAPKLLVLILCAGLLIRPLELLNLGDASSKALGASPKRLRFFAIAVAVGLAAIVTSAVGVIGFIGLAAPTLARLAGARRVGSQILWSTVIGAGLLFLTDNAIQLLAGPLANFLPTGAVTALFGSPLLLLLLRSMTAERPMQPKAGSTARWKGSCGLSIALGVFPPLLILGLAVAIGRTPDGGWSMLSSAEWSIVSDFRVPRVLNAMTAGIMLALAGVLLQRLSRNDMASPEVLGVSSGAMLGLAAGVFVFSGLQTFPLIVCASLGALAVLLGILLLNRTSGFQAERMVLAGIAFAALLDALIGALAAAGDPRSLVLLRWMSGSTYGATWQSAAITIGVCLSLGLMALSAFRWLDILDLGASSAQALGVPVKKARVLLFVLAGLLTATATLSVGPLSFVGLMAPHIARQLGFVRALPQLLVAASSGASLMVFADWVGRNANFPFDMPAGLISALIGTPLLMLLLSRKRA